MTIVRAIIHRFIEGVLNILFPPRCVHCKTSIQHQELFLCPSCYDAIATNRFVFCPRCLARLPDLRAHCHQHVPFVLAPACWYQDPLPALIHHFKYKKLLGIRIVCAALVITYLKQLPIQFSEYVITSIPLHHSRMRERGFNQAEHIALLCASYFKIPYISLLRRVKKTPQQALIAGEEKRHHNISGAFCVIFQKTMPQKIILIDDISTSGATLYEAATALKKAGARHIIGTVVAKAQ